MSSPIEGNVFFRPEELGFFDNINAEVQRIVAQRARYYLKILPLVTQDDARFERDVLYGEQKRNWKFVGPVIVPIHVETPSEPKEFEENRGGNQDINAFASLSRKSFEDAIPEDLANPIIAARGLLVPDAGDVIAIWTTHEGDVAFWDVESVERDAYLGDLPLHLQWRLTLHRRTRYAAERAFGPTLEENEPIVILDSEEFDTKMRSRAVRPNLPQEGKIVEDDLMKRILGL